MPFTSPKPKHLEMKETKDFMKLENGVYGAINFNNLIPVPDQQLIRIRIEGIRDAKYRYLLNRQFNIIRSKENEIIERAVTLRNLLLSDDSNLSWIDIKVKNRCCNLKLLESVYNNFRGQKKICIIQTGKQPDATSVSWYLCESSRLFLKEKSNSVRASR